MVDQPGDGRRLEQVGAVFDMTAQAVRTVPDVHGDVEDRHAAVEIDRRPHGAAGRAALRAARKRAGSSPGTAGCGRGRARAAIPRRAFQKAVPDARSVERDLAHPRKQGSEAGVALKSARRTSELTKKPIRPSSSARSRPATRSRPRHPPARCSAESSAVKTANRVMNSVAPSRCASARKASFSGRGIVIA